MRATRWLSCLVVMTCLSGCGDEKATGGQSAVENTLELCQDELDNDDDSFVDCADQDCWALVVCAARNGGDVGEPPEDVGVDPPDISDGPDPGPSEPDATEPGEAESPDVAPPLDVGPSKPCDPCGMGSLVGKVCAPNDQIFVNGATITIETYDCDGKLLTLTTESSANGTYQFAEVPCGTHTVFVEKGSFSIEYTITVEAGQETDLTGAAQKLCFQASSTPIAVLAGSYDNIESLLDQLGLDYDRYTKTGDGGIGTIVDLLGDPAALQSYDIVFVNCGGYHGWMPIDVPEVMPNVKDFVLAGGSLYMSDYAWVYGEWAFPDAIEFYNSDLVTDMYTDKSPQMIDGGQTFKATVADGAMAAYLGKTSLMVTFDQGPQIAPEAAGPGTFPHVSAKVSQPFGSEPLDDTIPLILSYQPTPTSGRVIYTNFHNDAQTTEDMLVLLNYLVFTL